MTISPGNTPPRPVIEAPADGAPWSVGERIQFRGSAQDDQENAWRARSNGCSRRPLPAGHRGLPRAPRRTCRRRVGLDRGPGARLLLARGADPRREGLGSGSPAASVRGSTRVRPASACGRRRRARRSARAGSTAPTSSARSSPARGCRSAPSRRRPSGTCCGASTAGATGPLRRCARRPRRPTSRSPRASGARRRGGDAHAGAQRDRRARARAAGRIPLPPRSRSCCGSPSRGPPHGGSRRRPVLVTCTPSYAGRPRAASCSRDDERARCLTRRRARALRGSGRRSVSREVALRAAARLGGAARRRTACIRLEVTVATPREARARMAVRGPAQAPRSRLQGTGLLPSVGRLRPPRGRC